MHSESLGMAGGESTCSKLCPQKLPRGSGAASWALLWEEQLMAQQNRLNCIEWPQISAPCIFPLDLQETDGICGEMGLFWDGSGSFLPSLKAPSAGCGTLAAHPGLEWDQRGQ